MIDKHSPNDQNINCENLGNNRYTRDSLKILSSEELIDLLINVQNENLLLKEQNLDKKNAEQELSKRLEGEKLLAEITSQFIQAEVAQNERQIPIALQKMAEYLKADIGFIRFIDINNNSIRNGFDWKKPSLEINNFENYNISVDQPLNSQ